MPKMKTKSGAKKRFRFTATGKVKHGVVGKRHGMSKRGNRFLRQADRHGASCPSPTRASSSATSSRTRGRPWHASSGA